ncbi:hypothetical protein EDD18DRAFT_1111891 [Armillaria luteobubalina]|uniref:Mug135-like C-terminal domain-containing protein n=1 Tax=Armillaria luteobubalina TaxID=153913 RepID=A0AA39PIC2_9AGAR|nr:hypothetical protein EDD18DRAFT_1111891 [Armillaria luteobubalina]
MPEVPQPVPLRPIMPPVLPPTAAEFLTCLGMPDPKPSLKNITNSNAYIDQVITHLHSSQKPTLTDNDLSRAIVHHHRLLTAHTDSAAQIKMTITTLQTEIKDVKASLVQVKKDLLEKIHGISTNITGVNQKLQVQSKSIIYIAILMAHTYNLSCGDSHDCPYVVVSSPMGRSPAEGDFWTGRNLLPPLECVDDFCALKDAQLDGQMPFSLPCLHTCPSILGGSKVDFGVKPSDDDNSDSVSRGEEGGNQEIGMERRRSDQEGSSMGTVGGGKLTALLPDDSDDSRCYATNSPQPIPVIGWRHYWLSS